MRVSMVAMALPLVSLAACGGAGPQSAGSIAAPAPTTVSTGSGTGVGTATPTPTPGTSTGGTGTGVTGNGTTATPAATTFLSVASATTFDAIGAMHSISVDSTKGTLYQGNASTVRAPSGQITYNPRDGIFTIAFADTKAGVTRNTTYQDPAHRTDFNPESSPALEVPNLDGFNYLSALDGTDNNTFFYQRPGNSTTYVSLAGFSRSTLSNTLYTAEHGVFVFGSLTPQSQIPISGTGSYTGGFIASATLNPTFDSVNRQGDYLQWLYGSSTISVDFSRATVGLAFTGTAGPTYLKNVRVSDSALSFPSGSVFQASATAALDLVRSGGFTGEFTSATLGGKTIDFARVSPGSSTAGASSVDGAFFGPNAANVGGNFRIVGGVPDQRIDIQGAFTGAKK